MSIIYYIEPKSDYDFDLNPISERAKFEEQTKTYNRRIWTDEQLERIKQDRELLKEKNKKLGE